MKTSMTKMMALVAMVGVLSVTSVSSAQQNSRALLAYLDVQPGNERQFLEAARDVIIKSRQESGVIIYNFHRSVTNPSQFVIYELFRSEEDLQSHRNSPHVVGFLNTVRPILVPNGFRLVEYR